jgi:hypothetical protein
MIAYNKDWLDNLAIIKQSIRWFRAGVLNEEELSAIKTGFPAPFQSHHLIIRLGLFVFTYILISASIGLVSLVLSGFNSEKVFQVMNLVYASVCFAVLEKFIRENKYFKAGIDDGLLYAGIGFLLFGLGWILVELQLENPINLVIILSVLSILIFGVATIRYIDHGMALLTIISSYVFVFCLLMKTGDLAKLIMPFCIFGLSVVFYNLIQHYVQKIELRFWKTHLELGRVVTLVMAFASLNYFVVREAGVEFFDMQIAEGNDIPFAWIFYGATVGVPLIYIILGLRNKDRNLIRIGLVLIVLSILTIRYYHTIAPIEITLTISGILVVGLAYFSIRFLKSKETAFTFLADPEISGNSNTEALILAQTFAKTGAVPDDANVRFGGGNLGGGGASGSF